MTIIEIAKKIRHIGGNLYTVGGAVRNKIIGIPIKDEDYCITGITKENFINNFPEARYQGKSFGVFILEENQIKTIKFENEVKKGKIKVIKVDKVKGSKFCFGKEG